MTDNSFTARAARTQIVGKREVLQLVTSGSPQGDLLDLSPNSDELCNLDKAIGDFQEALKQRTTRREPAVQSTADLSQEVVLKKRVPTVPASATITTNTSADTAINTPGTSEKAKTTPQDRRPLAVAPEPQQGRIVPTGGIICFECGTSFSNVLALQQHQMSNKHNYCDLCYAFFADRKVLQKHKGQVHNFRCATCTLVHLTLEDLYSHQQLKSHCYCKACNSYFRDMASHKQHMTVLHDKSRHEPGVAPATNVSPVLKYKCTVQGCVFSSTSPDKLKTHQQRENHNFCRPCNKTFCDAVALSNHKKAGGRHTENLKRASGQACS